MPAQGSARDLAKRLRELRQRGWSERRITQPELAAALDVSVPSISSWESRTNPTVPPVHRLTAYATFFATERSTEQSPFRVLDPSELTSEEKRRRDELLDELTRLSGNAHDSGRNIWRFEPDQDITIVCSELPKSYRERLPYADPNAPDHVELYKYADLDALLELFGHIRAMNPTNEVHVRTPTEMGADEYTGHLVLLGGVDWNTVTADLLHRVELPVRQMHRVSDAEPGGFEVVEAGRSKLLTPGLRKVGDREILEHDIAHFYRSVSPFNDERTVTICNGMYQRGTLGAVRTLTDARFRDRNDEYVRTHFPDPTTFSIVSRVQVINSKVVTPDWTNPEDRLHEWPVAPA